MNQTIRFLEEKGLILEVVSSMPSVHTESLDPVWEVLQMTDLTGHIRIYVTRKVQGAHGEGKRIVKIVGLSEGYSSVIVKCQSEPEYSYECRLSAKANGASTVTPSSVIYQKMKSICGTSWFDPNKPQTKRSPSTPSTQKPLTALGPVVENALKPPTPAAPPQPEVKVTDLRGFTKDRNKVKLVFQSIATLLPGQIDSGKISTIIFDLVKTEDEDRKLKSTGRIIGTWADNGLLKREKKFGKVVIYTLTEFAIRTFELVVSTTAKVAQPAATDTTPVLLVQIPAPSPQTSTTPIEELTGMLKGLQESAKCYQDARAASDDLELRKMELEEEMRGIQTKLDGLKPILDNPEFQKAHELWSNLREYGKPKA